MNSRQSISICAGIAVAAAAFGWWWATRAPIADPKPDIVAGAVGNSGAGAGAGNRGNTEPADRPTPAWTWEPGTVATYALRYVEDGSVGVSDEGSLDVRATIDAVVRLEVLAGTPRRVEWRVEGVREASWLVDGELAPSTGDGDEDGADERADAGADEGAESDANPYREALVGHAVFVELAPEGGVARVESSATDPPVLATLVQRWSRIAHVSAPPYDQSPAETTVDTGWGVLRARWEWFTEPADATLLAEWKPSDYEAFAPGIEARPSSAKGFGVARIEVTSGVLDRVEFREQVTDASGRRGAYAREDSLTLRRIDVKRVPPRVLPRDTGLVDSAGLRGRALENALRERTKGLTWEQMRADLLQSAASGRVKRHNRWLWQASGLLRLHPELALEMQELFFEESMQTPGRALLVDLLANVGHAEAQQALRAIVSDERTQRDPAFGNLVQRVGLLPRPEAETLQTIRAAWESPPTPEARRATSATLGALASKLRGDDPALARQAVDALSEAYRIGEGPEAQAALMGIGNSADPDTVPLVMEAASSDVADTRVVAARALRHHHGAEASAALGSMLADPSESVQLSAVGALREHPPTAAACTALMAALQSGGVSESAAKPLVQLAATWARRAKDEGGIPPEMRTLTQVLAAYPWKAKPSQHAAVRLARDLAKGL